MKKILVPTDFSDYALNALKLAAKIAEKTNATIYLFHIVNIPSYETGILPFQNEQSLPEGMHIIKHVKQKFKDLIASDFLSKVRVIEALQFGGFFESIADQAEKAEIDLIVMGTHGTSGFVQDTFVGNVTDKVVRNSNIPVITLRNEVSTPIFPIIVFASDFEDIDAIPFKKISSFLEAFDTKLHLLRVATIGDFITNREAKEKMEAFVKKNNISNYSINVFNASQVQTGINEFAQNSNADLIITPTKGRAGLALLLNGSIAIDLMKDAVPPVMTVKM